MFHRNPVCSLRGFHFHFSSRHSAGGVYFFQLNIFLEIPFIWASSINDLLNPDNKQSFLCNNEPNYQI